MAKTLANLQNDVLSRLNEAANTPAGNLEAGDGGAATITTAATIAQYLNEGAADLARTAFPISNAGTFAWPAGAQASVMANFVAADGSTLWAARGVAWNGQALTHCSRSALENWYPTWAADAPGTPLYWFDTGQNGISLYPIPSTTQNVVTNGLALPAPLVNAGDTPAWLPDDLTKLMVFYAAAMIAAKNGEDQSLAARAEIWRGEYESGKAKLLGRLAMMDPMLARMLTPPGGK